jgi:hypothetical protein
MEAIWIYYGFCGAIANFVGPKKNMWVSGFFI